MGGATHTSGRVRQSERQSAELAAMMRMLAVSKGTPSISVAICNSPALRGYLIGEALKEEPKVAVVEIPEDVTDVFDYAQQEVKGEKCEGVFVIGIEKQVRSDAKSPKVLKGLNATRDLWGKAYKCAIVFWMPEYVAQLFSVEARDIWSWVSHKFMFFSEEATPISAINDVFAGDLMGARNLPLAEKRFRITELEERVRQVGRITDSKLARHALTWLNELGWIRIHLGELDGAEEALKKTIEIGERLGLKNEVASALHLTGMIHQEGGDLEKALAKYEEALKVAEECGNRGEMGRALHQIGIIHQKRGSLQEALPKYEESLRIKEEMGDRRSMASSLHQIGMIYQDRGNQNEALEEYEKALKMSEEMGDKGGMAVSLQQIGQIYQERGNLKEALEKFEESLRIKEEIGNKGGMAISMHQIGLLFLETRQYAEAFKRLITALIAFTEIGMPEARKTLLVLSELRQAWGGEEFDKAWREKTGEEVPDELKGEG